MRALVFSSLLISSLTTALAILIMCGTQMATEGLPLGRQERNHPSKGIIAGADFLSILMESSLHRAQATTSPTSFTTSTTGMTTLFPEGETFPYDDQGNHLRSSRSQSPFAQASTEKLVAKEKDIHLESNNDISNDGVVLAISISSSIGKMINKELHDSTKYEETTLCDTITTSPTTELDQNFVASEEHPSIVAKASKSELSVEEIEPITQERDLELEEYPARVRAIPSHHETQYHPAFINQNLNSKQPFSQTLIYHDNPAAQNSARSVSYSTVVQGVNQHPELVKKQHERHERNFDGAQPYRNNYGSNESRLKQNDTKVSIEDTSQDKKKVFNVNTAFSKSWDNSRSLTTERNWETQEKPYIPPSPTPAHLPIVYGQPERNYEVDEAVSVVTNGRAHGLQPSLPPKPDLRLKKLDDNQKVGYVVEGRNYRKYRVEERTADGFIVGEYGVVSHNDGSLRGVRYTADGTINPKVISEALMKFLAL